jgi:DNA-binding NtrC family response regulator
MVRDSDAEVEVEAGVEAGAGAGATGADVLVVDDEPLVRGFMVKVLSRNGFTCRPAADAGEALAAMLERAPSLVITDVRMPGKDGSWLLAELRKRWPAVPVIVLTGLPDAPPAVECLKGGAHDYLLKPIDIEEFVASARRAVAGEGSLPLRAAAVSHE